MLVLFLLPCNCLVLISNHESGDTVCLSCSLCRVCSPLFPLPAPRSPLPPLPSPLSLLVHSIIIRFSTLSWISTLKYYMCSLSTYRTAPQQVYYLLFPSPLSPLPSPLSPLPSPLSPLPSPLSPLPLSPLPLPSPFTLLLTVAGRSNYLDLFLIPPVSDIPL